MSSGNMTPSNSSDNRSTRISGTFTNPGLTADFLAPEPQPSHLDDALPALPSRRRVTVLSLGGTIFMAQDEQGGHAAPGQSDHVVTSTLVEGVEVTHHQVANVGSPSIRRHHLVEILSLANAALREGADGVVITHGTDTLEETAFLLNRYWPHPEPLVVTGAMRPANAPGADGPANLRDAVFVAASDSARGLGVLVCFNGALHLADRVTKLHSRSVDAFASEPSGPVAVVAHDGIRLNYRPTFATYRSRAASAFDFAQPQAATEISDCRIPVISLPVFDDGEILDLLQPMQSSPRPLGAKIEAKASGIEPATPNPAEISGIVIVGSGMGHVAAAAVPRIRRLTAAGIPVVVATRVRQGGTSSRHYDYPGSEVDLIANGAIMAGNLPPHKARLLLEVLIRDEVSLDDIRREFSTWSY